MGAPIFGHVFRADTETTSANIQMCAWSAIETYGNVRVHTGPHSRARTNIARRWLEVFEKDSTVGISQ